MSDKPKNDGENKLDMSETYVIRESNALDAIKTVFERFMSHQMPFGFNAQTEPDTYHALPYKPESNDELLLEEPWRIILELYQQNERMTLGIDLYGDIIFGRGESRPGRIILNLDPHDAQKLGVSREHAMLRPTANRLFLIDQGSTNGTTLNGASSGRGMASAVKHEDIIALGNMMLMVKILKKPGEWDKSPDVRPVL